MVTICMAPQLRTGILAAIPTVILCKLLVTCHRRLPDINFIKCIGTADWVDLAKHQKAVYINYSRMEERKMRLGST